MRILARKRRAGFVLAEVLVVTGILTSLGSGSFQNVTNKAHQVACMNNLKQIYTSIQLLTAEGEPLPKAWFYPPDNAPNREQYNIVNLLKAQGCPPQMFICPSAPEAIQKRKICYLYNDMVGGKDLDTVGDPSNTWLMMDVNCATALVPPAHVGGANVLFVDGHVKWMPANLLPKLTPPATPQAGAAQQHNDDE